MAWLIPDEERKYLRELAKKQAEYAALPVMQERRKMWLDLNDGRGARPPVVIETWTFDRDFMPPDIVRCKSDQGRGIEWQLLRTIREHELINDDKVVPATYNTCWWMGVDETGVNVESEHVKDSQGYDMGYRFFHPIKNLKEDLGILKPPKCSVDRVGTLSYKAFLEDLIGDILPVRMQGWLPGCRNLTQVVIRLMGMEAFFLAMYDSPEEVHKLMATLRDNSLQVLRWAEAENLLVLNNEVPDNCASSSCLTRKLPGPGFDPKHVRPCDMWAGADSQETVGLSPEMFHEFCFPYYRDVCEPAGLLYWGCCEPADPFWGDLSCMPHLKKISISRWCDQKFMGDALRGTDIVFSRKPDPKYLGVDPKLDEVAWAAHIRETLEATRGVATEFIVRDVYTVHGDLGNPRRAVEVARREIDKHYRR